MRVKKILHETAGETLVEVLVSIFLFLMMMGILQGAVSYSNAALKKNKEIRKENAQIIENLKTASESTSSYTTEEKTLSFSAVSSDFATLGNQVFQVPVKLKKVTVPYESANGMAETTQFSLYEKVELPGTAGGESP